MERLKNNSKITIKVDYCNLWNDEFQKYLLNLNGINNIIKNGDDEVITIEYNEDITLYIIVKEILLYFDIEIPSISYFNKYMEGDLERCIIPAYYLCCEYCIKSDIEKLLYVNGINEVCTSGEELYIYYDKNKITKEEILELIGDNYEKEERKN